MVITNELEIWISCDSQAVLLNQRLYGYQTALQLAKKVTSSIYMTFTTVVQLLNTDNAQLTTFNNGSKLCQPWEEKSDL